jgi:hypothetical protein
LDSNNNTGSSSGSSNSSDHGASSSTPELNYKHLISTPKLLGGSGDSSSEGAPATFSGVGVLSSSMSMSSFGSFNLNASGPMSSSYSPSAVQSAMGSSESSSPSPRRGLSPAERRTSYQRVSSVDLLENKGIWYLAHYANYIWAVVHRVIFRLDPVVCHCLLSCCFF